MALDGQRMSALAILTLGLASGVALGLIYFRLVRVSCDLLLAGRRGAVWQGVALIVARLAGLGAVLTCAALLGAGPLLAVSLGWLVGRYAMMRRAA